VFLAFWGFSIVAVVYGFTNGNLENIAQPYDDVGNACGVPGPTLEFNYLFVTSPNIECFTNSNVTDCSKVISYKTTAVTEFCIPDVSDYMKGFNEKLKDLGSETLVQDISNSWMLFLICLGAAFLISALYCLLLEYCAGLIITILIVALLGGLITLGFLLKAEHDGIQSGERPGSDNKDFYKWGYIISWVLAGVLTCLVCCMWSRIVLAVKIIQATADFITDYQQVLLVPVLSIILFVAYISYWVYTGAYIFSTGKTEFVKGRAFGKIKWTDETRVFWYTHVFALFWKIAFILYLSNFVIGFIVVTWYFSADKHSIGSPFTYGYCLGLTKHIGSIALGAFLLAVIWSIQLILAYVQQKVEESGAAENTMVRWIMACLQCLVECFKRLIKFISKHAFIEIAINSCSFCGGAAAAMNLIISNAMRMGILHGICSICISFGTIAITTLTILTGYLLLRYVKRFDDAVTQLTSPLIIVGIIGYVVSKLFGYVFEVSSDAMIHCYLTEENETGSSGQQSEKLSKVIEDAKENHGHLLDNDPAPGYKVENKPKRAVYQDHDYQ